VKVQDAEGTGEDPNLLSQSPEQLLALAQSSDNPQQFLEDIALADAPANTGAVDNIEDQATLDSILSQLAQNPDFDGGLEAVHGMVGELMAQIQGGEISPDAAQEQLVFNIVNLFDSQSEVM
jgi:hypothetical protein